MYYKSFFSFLVELTNAHRHMTNIFNALFTPNILLVSSLLTAFVNLLVRMGRVTPVPKAKKEMGRYMIQ